MLTGREKYHAARQGLEDTLPSDRVPLSHGRRGILCVLVYNRVDHVGVCVDMDILRRYGIMPGTISIQSGMVGFHFPPRFVNPFPASIDPSR